MSGSAAPTPWHAQGLRIAARGDSGYYSQAMGKQRDTAKLVSETVEGEYYQYFPLGEHVVRAIGVCGGRPTFKYTRIEITGALDRLAHGETLDDLVAGYRGRVSRDAIVEAVHLVTRRFLSSLPELKLAS